MFARKTYNNNFLKSPPICLTIYGPDLKLTDMNDVALNYWSPESKKELLIGEHVTKLFPDIGESGRYSQYLNGLKTVKPLLLDEVVPHPRFGDIVVMVSAFKLGEHLGIIEIERAQGHHDHAGGVFTFSYSNINILFTVIQTRGMRA